MDKQFHHKSLELTERIPVVYVAMSKHWFHLRVEMSRFVFGRRRCPINPFMNFDYDFFGLIEKDTIMRANNSLLHSAD